VATLGIVEETASPTLQEGLEFLANDLALVFSYLGREPPDNLAEAFARQPWTHPDKDRLLLTLGLVSQFIDGTRAADPQRRLGDEEFPRLRAAVRSVVTATSSDDTDFALALELQRRLVDCLTAAPIETQKAVLGRFGQLERADILRDSVSVRCTNRTALVLTAGGLVVLCGLQMAVALGAATAGSIRQGFDVATAALLGSLVVFGLLGVLLRKPVGHLGPVRVPLPGDNYKELVSWLRLSNPPWVIALTWAVVPVLIIAAGFVILAEANHEGNTSLLIAGPTLGWLAVLVFVGAQSRERSRVPREGSAADAALLYRHVDDDTTFINKLEADIGKQVLDEEKRGRTWNWTNYGLGGAATLLSAVGGAAGLSKLTGTPRLLLGIGGLLGAGLAGTVTTIKAGGNAEAAEARRLQFEGLLLDMDRWRDKGSEADPGEIDTFIARVHAIRGVGRATTEAKPPPRRRPPTATKS
jgi:hypothetical protein